MNERINIMNDRFKQTKQQMSKQLDEMSKKIELTVQNMMKNEKKCESLY